MDIYVGNLPYDTDEQTIRDAFSAHGNVDNVNIIYDRHTGRAKGFAFVAMSDLKEAQSAIDALDNTDVGGRPIKVNQARPREERAPRGDRRRQFGLTYK